MAGQGMVYLGCYTPESGGRGAGIVAARWDPDDAVWEPLGTVAVTPAPSFLARHPWLPVLYAVNELAEGTVSAWRIGTDGRLHPLGTRATDGDGPCHLAVSPDGGQLYVANYGSGSVGVHPVDRAGVPGPCGDLHRHRGHGSNPGRQERAHVHMISPDPGGTSLLAVDLGTDAVYRYDRDDGAGRLVACGPVLRTPSGSGPRHLARHPDGRRCYLAGELDGTVIAAEWQGPDSLRVQGRVPASRRSGLVQPSEIAVGPDGRFLYLANRGVGTVSVFALDAELPRLVAEVASGGSWPRHFALAVGWLFVADERADLVQAFRVDPVDGVPAPVGEPLRTGSPTCVLYHT